MDLKSIPKSSKLVTAALAILVIITWLPITDHIADADVDAGFNRALASFAIAKGLNMVISLLQSTQISAQPFGFGIAMTLGELLDPINDLVEQFSNIMLLATVAFGIQKVLIAIGGHTLVKTLLSAFAITVAWLAYKDRPVPHWLKNALILIALVRLAVPAATVLSNGAYQIFLEPQYQASTAALNESSSQLEALKSSTQGPLPPASQSETVAAPQVEETPTSQAEALAGPQAEAPPTSQAEAVAGPQAVVSPANESLWSKAKRKVSDFFHRASPSNFMERFNSKVNGMKQAILQIGEELTRNIVNQIVVFLLQTLIFPIGLIWALYKIGVSMMYRSKN